ncbi:MAG: polysaccharide pyruvyl transferase family protein [Actinobacteria bacterium]|nr:polysaccharide pyruvyl transferase family protein [Actinomycetota bacterium]
MTTMYSALGVIMYRRKIKLTLPSNGEGFIEERKYCGSLARRNWEEILYRKLMQYVSSPSEFHIGIIGALGSNDVGDEAMLCAMMDTFKNWWSSARITVFSNRPEVTNTYLGISSKSTLYRVLNNRKSLLSWFLHSINKLEDVLITNFLKSALKLKETSCSGWFFRVCYMILSLYVYFVAKQIAKGRKIFFKNLITEHLEALKDLDVLVFLGGGYLNSWHVKANIYPYILSAKCAIIFSKPIFATGLNLGPFNRFDKLQIGKIIKEFELIGVRDSNESFKILSDLKVEKNKFYFSSDDAITLKSSSLNNEELEDFVRTKYPYLNVQIHLWRLKNKQAEYLMYSVAKAIDSVIKELDLNVVMIPMQFGKEPVKDRVTMENIRQMCHFKNKIIMAPKYLRPEQLKFIFSYGQATLCTRHHSMVFSLGEGVPMCVIELDEYYRMKLFGIAQEFPNICRIISINQEELDKKIVDNIINLIKQRVQNV